MQLGHVKYSNTPKRPAWVRVKYERKVHGVYKLWKWKLLKLCVGVSMADNERLDIKDIRTVEMAFWWDKLPILASNDAS